MSVAPSRWVIRLRRRFQFNEGARRLTCALEGNIRSADARRRILGDDYERIRGYVREHRFQQALEFWGERQFLIRRSRSTLFADPPRIFNQYLDDHVRTVG